MSSFTLTAGADAATVNLRENTVAGEIKYVVKAALTRRRIGSSRTRCAAMRTTMWVVDLSAGTMPQMTNAGDRLMRWSRWMEAE
jgi:hypothetical protein